MTETDKIGEVTARAEVEQDRLRIVDDTTRGVLYVKQTRDETPLSSDERHLKMKLLTENGTVEIGLNAEQMDQLEGAIHHIQEAYNE